MEKVPTCRNACGIVSNETEEEDVVVDIEPCIALTKLIKVRVRGNKEELMIVIGISLEGLSRESGHFTVGVDHHGFLVIGVGSH